MTYTEEMTTSEILLRLASMRNELLQAVNDIEKISKNICYKTEQTEPTISKMEQVDKDINVRSKDCTTCRHAGEIYEDPCELCYRHSHYEPKDEPQTNGYQTFNGTSVYVSRLEGEPQTDCARMKGADDE